MHCPICNNTNTRFLFESYDDRFGYPDSFPLYQCRKCKHIFLHGDFTPEFLTDLYTNYYPWSSLDVDAYAPFPERRGFLAWLDGERALCHTWVPKNARVLDIGCGFCETLGYHKNRGCEVYGVEADETAQRIADEYGFNLHIGLFDPNNYDENFFDYVTLNYVVEHLNEPIDVMRGVAKVLKPGGRLVFNIPNPYCLARYFFGKRWDDWHTPYHLHFFSRTSIEIALAKAGLEVESSKTITWSILLLYQWVHLFIRERQGVPSPLSKTVGEFFDEEQRKRWDVRLYQVLKFIRIHAWVTRIVDSLGVGDHWVYVCVKTR